MIPSADPFTIKEGNTIEFECVVNSNAVPTPVFTWYLGSTNSKERTGTNTNFINITANKKDNTKTLMCNATNNNNTAKTAATTLNVECKYKLRIIYLIRVVYTARVMILLLRKG